MEITYSNEHSWVHRENEVIEEDVIFADKEGLHVGAGVDDC